MPDHSQFSIDRTYPGRWTITFNNPPINIFVPATIVELGALMTRVIRFSYRKPRRWRLGDIRRSVRILRPA